jgi:hypothetical protein
LELSELINICMSIPEEGSKVAISFIEVMKKEPISLALVIMNICLLAFFYIWFNAWEAQNERELNLLYYDNKEVRETLAKCIVPSSIIR